MNAKFPAESPAADLLFPGGPWRGYYLHRGSTHRHRMDLHLKFGGGLVDGHGSDDIGAFVIRGHYDRETLVVSWTKTYSGAHDVFYRGFREGRGIWGTWEIRSDRTGGFRIWPGASEEEVGEAARQATGLPAALGHS